MNPLERFVFIFEGNFNLKGVVGELSMKYCRKIF